MHSPLKGAKFTWSNFQNQVFLSRLDCFLFCGEWEELFPDRSQIAMPRTTLDHISIFLE